MEVNMGIYTHTHTHKWFSLKYHSTCSMTVLHTIESWHKGIPMVLFTKFYVDCRNFSYK